MKKIEICLAFLCIILGIFFIFGIFKSKIKNNSNPQILSTLVNPKYNEKINEIKITKNEQELILTKKQKSEKNYEWFLNFDETTIKADKKLVEQLLKNLTNIIKLYKISYTNKANPDTFINKMQIMINSDEIISDISFSNPDFTQSKIFIKNNKTNKKYQIYDDFSYFFDLKIKEWGNKNFFSEEFTSDPFSIQTIYFKDFTKNKSKVLKKGQENFSEFLNSIINLQSSDIIIKSNDDVFFETFIKSIILNPISQITIENGLTKKETIQIFKLEKNYYCKSQNIFYRISYQTANKLFMGNRLEE
ncbi:MAG: hypothetical protein ACTTHG_00895 [Treponemataceae bacterium]